VGCIPKIAAARRDSGQGRATQAYGCVKSSGTLRQCSGV
jgi:hypothetical protein